MAPVMRILHAYKIYLPDVHGGVPHVIAMLAKLPRSGFQTFVLVARHFGFGRRYVIDGAAVSAVTSLGTLFSTPLALSYPFVFARRARMVDLVVHHAPFPLLDIGLLFGLPKRVALIVYWHAEVVGRPFLARLMAPFMRRTLARADRIVVSDQAIIEHSPFLRPHAAKCTVVPFGCDVEYWSGLDEVQRQAVDDLKVRYPRLVVAVGRLVGYKGYDILLRAMRDVDAQAIIVGEGPLQEQLENLAAQLGISNRITFVGGLHRDEVKQYLHAAKVLAFPSVTAAEAFGIVQLEAMSAGLPIVNTSLSTAVPHIARDGREGLTVPSNDAVALADALRRLLDEPELARKLGQAGHARASAEYQQSQFMDRMQAVFKETVDQRRLIQ
jgi:glycosyltransferase involved in cell wall biosynthesis